MPKKSGPWLLLWVLLTVLSWFAGQVAIGLLIGVIYRADVSAMLFPTISIVGTVLLGNVLAGAAQSLLLPRDWNITRQWFINTALGVLIGSASMLVIGVGAFLVLVAGIVLLSQGVSSDAAGWGYAIMGPIAFLIAIVIGWFGLGATIAIFQRRVLKRQVQNPGPWVRTTVQGWVLGVPLVVLLFWILNAFASDLSRMANARSSWNENSGFVLILLYLLYPAFIAFVTGRRLNQWIQEQRNSNIPPQNV